ncbi:cell wall-binding protein [Methylotuvimicrobium sp. KM1]|uniref:cell wall-binding protein n=1 Tax=Methylotuvimicrobium sp. KM1 TaxID=3377707 RepID=UPI00384B2ABE
MSKDNVIDLVNKPKKPKKPGNSGGSGTGSGSKAEKRFGDYAIINNAFHHIKSVRSGPDGQGFIEILLCNFVCKIVQEVTTDTGLEDQAFVRIEGKRNDGVILPTIEVPFAKFFNSRGSWIGEHWGTRAFVPSGAMKADNLRAAIHLYSTLDGDVPRCHIYKYSGFKKIDDRWHYLTGSGAITEAGLFDSVQVDLGAGHMSRYALPAPPDRDELKTVAGALSDLLTVCPGKPQIGAALLAAVARAPLGECSPTDFSIFLQGVTGSRKSSVAAIALAFFGEFNARRFPANWSDTDNDLEHKAFAAKDAVFVVDDYKPSVSQAEASRLYSKAERFFRNTGNQAGRGRRGADLRALAAPYNRSMTIATGEDLPKGQSIIGRLLVLELTRADVDLVTLSRLQNAADTGALSRLMSFYIQWLCSRLDDLKASFGESIRCLRDAALRDGFANSHTRAPEIYASLVAGSEIFIDFLNDAGLVESVQGNVMLATIEDGLKAAFAEQSTYIEEQDEVQRFIELLRSVLVSGCGHIACRINQGPPDTRPHSFGWRADDSSGERVLRPMGAKIGWHSDKDGQILLNQGSTFKEIQQFARAQGEPFLMSAASLWRRLHERQLILATEKRGGGKVQLTVWRTIAGKQERVMILSANLIESAE